MFFIGYGAQKFSNEFHNNSWGLSKLCQKGYKKLTRWQGEVAALKTTESFLFFYFVIFMHKLDIIRKE